jgi:hypothetical protein
MASIFKLHKSDNASYGFLNVSFNVNLLLNFKDKININERGRNITFLETQSGGYHFPHLCHCCLDDGYIPNNKNELSCISL